MEKRAKIYAVIIRCCESGFIEPRRYAAIKRTRTDSGKEEYVN